MTQFQAEAKRQRQEVMDSVVQELIEKIFTYGITAKEPSSNLGSGVANITPMSSHRLKRP
jgi:hypothetical protein